MENQIDLYQKPNRAKPVLLLLVICLVLTITFVQEVRAQDQGPVYIVQPGDTLFSISLQFGTSIDLIAAANNISDPYIISPGQRLIIPGFEGASGVLELRQIQFGETLESLSSRYGTPPDAIVRLNRILNPDRLFIGQSAILSIPEGDVPQESLFNSEVDETALEFSIKHKQNPWKLHDFEKPIDRLWLIPDESLAIGFEGEFIPSGLPFQIQSVEISPERAVQGRTLEVRVILRSEIDVSGSIGDRELHFQTSQTHERIALQGIHALLEPGMYDMNLSFSKPGEVDGYGFTQALRVASGQYPFDPPLHVPPETIDPENTEPENELYTSIVNTITEEKYWEGVFQFPSTTTSVFSSIFGSRRNYNDTGYTSYHTGLDFFGGTGTPITSPAKGKVVFSGEMIVRGNLTIIDHGWGVFTAFFHQSEIQVSVDDSVEPGQIIGLVGSTGRADGAHLHWEVLVGGIPVDPLEWTSETYPALMQQP
jgi:murein DD-endopeptidase MepM/ murein hydrolase activator NlpD